MRFQMWKVVRRKSRLFTSHFSKWVWGSLYRSSRHCLMPRGVSSLASESSWWKWFVLRILHFLQGIELNPFMPWKTVSNCLKVSEIKRWDIRLVEDAFELFSLKKTPIREPKAIGVANNNVSFQLYRLEYCKCSGRCSIFICASAWDDGASRANGIAWHG